MKRFYVLKKIFIYSFVFLIFTLSVCGCGKSKSDEKIIGKWQVSINITNSVIKNIPDDLKEFFSIGDLYFYYDLQFNKDLTYKSFADESLNENLITNINEAYRQSFNNYCEKKIAEYNNTFTFEEFVSSFESQQSKTVDEFLKDSFDCEAFLKNITEQINKSGNYKASYDKLYMSDGTDFQIDINEYVTYEIKNNTLNFIKGYGENTKSDNLYPYSAERK